MLCVLDVNETLLDLAPLDSVFGRLTGCTSARREWFELVIHTALTVTAIGGYRDFGEIAGACTGAIAAQYGRRVSDEDVRTVGATLRSLPPHPEVPGALERLRAAGFDLVALTNSPLATAREQLRNSGLERILDRAFSVEQAGALKPAGAPYRMVLETHRVDPDKAIMIAAHGWDLAGAQAIGMRAGFVARPGKHLLPGSPPPIASAPDLDTLAEMLIAG